MKTPLACVHHKLFKASQDFVSISDKDNDISGNKKCFQSKVNIIFLVCS